MTVGPTFVIPARFNGPATTANGGYACGLIAGQVADLVAGRVVVTLHAPPPLETPLRVTGSGRRAHVWAGDELVATAAASTADPVTLPPVPAASARAAHAGYRGAGRHPFPTCFVCGTTRADDDGLRLRPGPVEHPADAVACEWTPDAAFAGESGEVAAAVVWGALDCPGGWASEELPDRPMVVSRMTAQVVSAPLAGVAHVVVGAVTARTGRTVTAATTLYDDRQTVAARALATWFLL
ncbi:hypothetical protein [Actinophytocola sediminis]